LKNNIEYYYNFDLDRTGKEVAKKDTLKKTERMMEKIRTDLGKELAQGFYEKAKEEILRK